MYVNPSWKRIALCSVCCEPRSHPTQLITNALEITHGHKYLQEWGLSEDLHLYEALWPNYANLKKKCSQTCCLHRRAVTNTARSGCCCPDGRDQEHGPWQPATSLRGLMHLLGMCLQTNPGKKKALPRLMTACRGTKVSLKPLYPCLQRADWGVGPWCLLAATPTISTVEMKGRPRDFMEAQWHMTLFPQSWFQGLWADPVPIYTHIWTPWQNTLKSDRFWSHFLWKNNLFLWSCFADFWIS